MVRVPVRRYYLVIDSERLKRYTRGCDTTARRRKEREDGVKRKDRPIDRSTVTSHRCTERLV